MTPAKLRTVLDAHAAWLADPSKGERANLFDCDLRSCDLSHKDLRRCALRHCDLSGSNLRGSNLRGSNLNYANLRGCDLSSTNLRDCALNYVQGYLCLGADFRGYHFRAVQFEDGWRITAGCRDFTLDEAKLHWGHNYDALARLTIVDARIASEAV